MVPLIFWRRGSDHRGWLCRAVPLSHDLLVDPFSEGEKERKTTSLCLEKDLGYELTKPPSYRVPGRTMASGSPGGYSDRGPGT